MFPDTTQLMFFLTATILLNLTPGNDVLFVASQSLISLRHGIYATIGIATGIALYAIASALGLSTILMKVPLVFNLIRIIGGLYLLYLAWQAFFHATDKQLILNKPEHSAWNAYKNGLLTNLLNPKVGIFFLTFLPQFIDMDRGFIGLQLLTLGGCFVISGTLINFAYTFLFVSLKDRVFANARAQKLLNHLTAFIFCLLALKILAE